eukprot:CAMPEP_0167745360 /NCGR_PEP_ID=MMETSP0110_2-20121227/3108_1 /TAXON_ID=629695 /ORGANISM="Gymnochlora sp., Strain CCMP2014" /LENGTH=288 /DNA_ID=CAMNT_0007629993 /DNA_START=1019 /DNA_END=1885 /DNA_ORIENTATION=+
MASGSTLRVAKQTVERFGIRSLWKGFLTCQAGIIPAHSVYVASLECSKEFIARGAIRGGYSDRISRQFSSFAGGATASFLSQLVRTPTDVIAQRLMIQGSAGSSTTYRSGFHALSTILKAEGIRGLYAGLGASILVSVPLSATFWGSYTVLKHQIGTSLSNIAHRQFSNQDVRMEYVSYHSKAPFGAMEAAVFSSAAFLSACIATAVTNPIDVVKTRIQTRAKTGRTAEGGRLAQSGAGIVRHLYSIIQFEGWRALTKGWTSRVLTSGTFSVLGILVYEGTKHMSRKC